MHHINSGDATRVDEGARGPLAINPCSGCFADGKSSARHRGMLTGGGLTRAWNSPQLVGLASKAGLRHRRGTAALDARQFLAVELIRHAHGAATPSIVLSTALMALLGRRRRHRWAAALGAAGAALGVIGACAHAAGAAIARAAAIATPFKRCFMPLSSVAVLDWTIRCYGLLHPKGDLWGPRGKNNRLVVPFPRTRNFWRHVSDLAGSG